MTFAFPVQFFRGRDMHGRSKLGISTLPALCCNKKYENTAFKVVQEIPLEIQKLKKLCGVACPKIPLFYFYEK